MNPASAHPKLPTDFYPKAGQEVHVRPVNEILSTLDENGTLDGLPFMPEMLSYCGRKFRVQRIANKTCVNADSVFIGALPRSVVLQIPDRCDGSGHGGCQMACKFFWRTQWLSPDAAENENQDSDQLRQVESYLSEKAIPAPGVYRCQATELVKITTPTKVFDASQYVRDVRDGVPAGQLVQFFASLAKRKLTRTSENLVGPCAGRTPARSWKLQVGERVRVKSLEEIRETLDGAGCNRGLWFDPTEMAGYCKKELVVSRVIERLIDEKTGELRELKSPCIVLSETECSGVFRRFCSRGMLHFWREIWLQRC